MRIRLEDRGAFVTLVELSARAAWEPHSAVTRRKAVSLARGQCVFGMRELAERLDMPVTTLRRKLDKLEQVGAITIEKSAMGSLATIPFLAGLAATAPGSRSSTQTDHSAAHSGASTPSAVGDSRHSAKSTGSLNGTQTDRSRLLTQSEAPDDVGAARRNSNSKEVGKEYDPRVIELHAYQEKWRRRVFRGAYRAIELGLVSAQIAARLADGYEVDDCKAVIRADADEGKAQYFGRGTFTTKNFEHKLQRQLEVEQTRRDRARESALTPRERLLLNERTLARHLREAELRGEEVTSREVLVANYQDFTWQFHKLKGTWSAVRHLRDREDHAWFRRDEVSPADFADDALRESTVR
jgi:DNA-binding transcriptional ArsR family regulator